MSESVKVMPASGYKADLNASGGAIRRKAVQVALELIHAQCTMRQVSITNELGNLGEYADAIEAALEKKA